MTTTTPTLTANEGTAYADLAEIVLGHIADGATEKQAWAVALHDAGKSNQEVGDAFGDLFGAPTKSGGAGDLVTAGLRAIGRGGEVESKAGGVIKKTVVRDASALIRDELDRARAALDTVTKPATDAEKALADLEADPDGAAAAQVDAIGGRVKALQTEIAALKAEATALKADPAPFVDAERARLQGAVDAARTAAGENRAADARRHRGARGHAGDDRRLIARTARESRRARAPATRLRNGRDRPADAPLPVHRQGVPPSLLEGGDPWCGAGLDWGYNFSEVRDRRWRSAGSGGCARTTRLPQLLRMNAAPAARQRVAAGARRNQPRHDSTSAGFCAVGL